MCKYQTVGAYEPECIYSGNCVHQTQGPYNPICGEAKAKGPNKDEYGVELCVYCGQVWEPGSQYPCSTTQFLECVYCGAS